jgi:hypothetical protein
MPPGARASRWFTSTAAISRCDRELAFLELFRVVFGGPHDEQQRARDHETEHDTGTFIKEGAGHQRGDRRVKEEADKCGSKTGNSPLVAADFCAAFDADYLFSCQQAIAIHAAFHDVSV